jgi:hypothetical protein
LLSSPKDPWRWLKQAGPRWRIMLFEQEVLYIDRTCPPTFRCGAPVTMALSAYQ